MARIHLEVGLIFHRSGPKTQNLVLTNVSFMFYRTLENVNLLYKLQILVHTKCALNQNCRKNVPANNCHPKVPKFHVEIQHLHWHPPYLKPTAPS